MNDKKGMTLLELMVYMVVAALLLVPIVFLMNNSSVNMARSATSADLRMSGRDILDLMYHDIKNMGFKIDPGSLNFYQNVTYFNMGIDPVIPDDPSATPPVIAQRDSSSFIAGNGAGAFDTLTFIKGRLNADGTSVVGVDTIRYFVELSNGDMTLVREVLGIDGNPKTPSEKRVFSRDVTVLQFEYSDTLVDWWDDFNDNTQTLKENLDDRKAIKFIKVHLVLKDNKEIAPSPPRAATIADYTFNPNDRATYERHDILIPVPNNGLFPCWPCTPMEF